MQSVMDIKAVRLENPASFWRNGKEETARDAVLIRVKVPNVSDFQPMGRTSPLFVLDGFVCQMIQDPFPAGDAILLAPAAGGARELLMTDPGEWAPSVNDSGRRAMKRVLSSAELKGRSLKVKAPAASAPVAAYKNVDDLRRDVLREGR
jgi:hypothetical protein